MHFNAHIYLFVQNLLTDASQQLDLADVSTCMTPCQTKIMLSSLGCTGGNNSSLAGRHVVRISRFPSIVLHRAPLLG